MVFTTGDFEIPKQSLGRITDRVQSGSVLAALSPERPTLYGDVGAVRMSRKPRAQIVAEGADKDSDTAEWSAVTASPVKFQTTVRLTDEVKWADDDHRLEIVDDLVDAIGESIARAVDLIGLHGVNPITGTVAGSVPSYLGQTTNRVEAGGDPTSEIEAAVGLIAGEGRFLPTGLGLDGGYAFQLATQRNNDGIKVNPDLGLGNNISSYSGISVATSSAVSGRPEVAGGTGVHALVGDFEQVRWGFQRRIPVEVIPYGDPDGNGDLQRNNQIAYRAEGVIYVAIFDLDAFAVVEAGAGSGGE